MAEHLAAGNAAIALLANTISPGAMLVVLTLVFGPLSGAHMNPAVSMVFLLRKKIAVLTFGCYALAQFCGAIVGVLLAHAMFDLPVLQVSSHTRASPGQWLSEAVATFGLVLTVLTVLRTRPTALPYAVGLYITAAYWFTASTSFANPAVTVARSLSNTFAGIDPAGVPAFVAAQFVGAILAVGITSWLETASLRSES
jgi:glycerol uptake facilitator-like aquaporin